MSFRRYPIVIEPANTGFSAFSPDLPGRAAAGDHFSMLRELGEPID
jgi:predicted RNase H-like HicB family nuclease